MTTVRKNKKKIIFAVIAFFVMALNILAWNSSGFCDGYITYVFPIWINTYGRFSGLFPFSLGEWLLVLGVVLVVTAGVLAPVALAVKIMHKISSLRQQKIRGMVSPLKRQRFLGVCRCFYIIFAWIFLGVCLIMTLNCLILYHASTFSEKYFEGGEEAYGLAEIMELRNAIVEKCNALSKEVNRDADGRILYPGDSAQMQDRAVEAMKNLGRGISYGEQAQKMRPYGQLDGYYPRPKAMFFSDFMCQQYMQGYYFPFSMEANYNDVMYVMNKPFTMCHELAHLRGYIFEDEANFIGYLACTQSEDLYFQYSGYLCAFSYLENDLRKAKKTAPNAYDQAMGEIGLSTVDAQVYADNIFVEQEEWDRINASALLSTETVDQAADVFIDTNLKINGVEDGALSYNRLVKLLMLYYSGESENKIS